MCVKNGKRHYICRNFLLILHANHSRQETSGQVTGKQAGKPRCYLVTCWLVILYYVFMVFKYDFLIIGAGVAGMSYALKIARAHKGKICIICKTTLDEANTAFAQGGVASVTNLEVDNFEKHIEDTMIAGDYISDRRAVEQVVRNAPAQIKELVQWACADKRVGAMGCAV